jgi:hypothetical protein
MILILIKINKTLENNKKCINNKNNNKIKTFKRFYSLTEYNFYLLITFYSIIYIIIIEI